MTAGRGIVHCEMFPLLDREGPNPVELFQIWLNLPAENKMADPHFSMFWRHAIPKKRIADAAGRISEITLVAGRWDDARAPSPPPKSWAASADADVAIWTIAMAPDAELRLPSARSGTGRSLYFFRGDCVSVGARTQREHAALQLSSSDAVTLKNGPSRAELLMLQGQPIEEPVAHHGPFVMNTAAEIHQAIADYQATGFGGWPWPSSDHVHAADAGRFAVHVDGRRESPRSEDD